MADSELSPATIKYTQHRNQTVRVKPITPRRHRRKPTTDTITSCSSSISGYRLPRVVRISVTDADATESSSDEEDRCRPRRITRFINQVNIETTTAVVGVSFPSARESGSDDAVLAGRVTLKRKWQGKAGGATASAIAAAFTSSSANFAIPPPVPEQSNQRETPPPDANRSGYNSGNESHHHSLCSPTTVLQSRLSAHEEVESIRPVKEEVPGSGSNICSPESFSDYSTFTGSFDSAFSGDFFACGIIPSVPDLFADSGLIQDNLCNDFGFGVSDNTWSNVDHILDMGEIFGSDPLVAL